MALCSFEDSGKIKTLQAKSLQQKIFKVLPLTEEFERDLLNREIMSKNFCVRVSFPEHDSIT